MFVVLCLMKTYQITSVSKLDECWERFLSVIFQDNQYLSPNCEINREGSIEEIWSMLGLLTWDKKIVAILHWEEIIWENTFCSYKALKAKWT